MNKGRKIDSVEFKYLDLEIFLTALQHVYVKFGNIQIRADNLNYFESADVYVDETTGEKVVYLIDK